MVVLTDQMAARVIPGFASMAMPPTFYFFTSIATDTLYSMVGGLLCAAIAREHAFRATVSLAIFGEVAGIASQIALWTTVPHWFGLALLLTYPPAVWFGSKLRVGRQLATASA
jgi:hypothetical protein